MLSARAVFDKYGRGGLAQLAEQLTLNQRVAGSSPAASTIYYFRFAIFDCR